MFSRIISKSNLPERLGFDSDPVVSQKSDDGQNPIEVGVGVFMAAGAGCLKQSVV